MITEFIKKYRKIILSSLVLIIGFIGIVKFVHIYFFMAPIMITSTEPGTLRLTLIPETDPNKVVRESDGSSLELRVSPGTYEAEVNSDKGSSSFTFVVTGRDKVEKQLEVKPEENILPYTLQTIPLSYIVTKNGDISYLDLLEGKVYTLLRSGERVENTTISSYGPIQFISWRDELNFSFITDTESRRVGVVNNGQLVYDQHIESHTDSTLNIIRSGDVTIYTVENKVYKISPSNVAEEIYTHNDDITAISFNGSMASIYTDNGNINSDLPEEEAKKVPDVLSKLIILNTNTKQVTSTNEDTSTLPLISPDGKLVAYQNAYTGIVADDTGKTLTTYPPGELYNWLSPTTLVYRQDLSLYSYDTDTNTSYKLISLPEEPLPSSVKIFNDRVFLQMGYLYLLTNLEIPGNVIKLLETTPFTTTNYQIRTSFNMGGVPQVVITSFAALNSDSQLAQYTEESRRYYNEALNHLKNNGVDISKLNIIYQ